MGLLVWLEALTAKQALLFSHLYHALRGRGHGVLVTTRSYDYSAGVLEVWGVEYAEVGAYGGDDLAGKLRAGLERQSGLLRLLEGLDKLPDVHVAFTSPDSTRVAYGLGIPIINLTDSPHSVHVNRLSLPLSRVVVAPECAAEGLARYAPDARILEFDGVFEVAWTRGFRPDPHALERWGLEPLNYAILRLEESKASYYPAGRGSLMDLIPLLARELGRVVVYPRYADQATELERLSSKYPNLVVPRRAIRLQDLEYYAALVVTGGSSMAQESALLGTTSVTAFPGRLEVVEYLRARGFPIFHAPGPRAALELVGSILRDPDAYRVDTSGMLGSLEDPVPLTVSAVEEVGGA